MRSCPNIYFLQCHICLNAVLLYCTNPRLSNPFDYPMSVERCWWSALFCLVAQSDARPTGDQKPACLILANIFFFVEIDYEMFYRVILSLCLIQEGQLSVSGEGICTSLPLKGLLKPVQEKMWFGKLNGLT